MMLERWNRSAAALLALVALAALLAAPAPAQAFVFNVTKTADTADGLCHTDCSLREAIVASNSTSDVDVILVPAGVYLLALAGEDDTAALGDLDIRGDVVLIGQGATPGDTVIDGAAIDRVLDIWNGTVEIQNLTIRNGRANGPGGGIRNSSRQLTVIRSIVTGNTTTNFGFGGGIFHDGPAAALILRDSTLSNNTASGGGGGLAAGGTVALSNVTVSNNRSSTDFGGGLYLFSDAEGRISNATITGNTAAERGGGVLVESSAFLGVDQPEFSNTIIAGNTAQIGDPDCSGAAASNGYNLLGVGGGCIGFTAAAHDQIGTAAAPINPLLGPLVANGGFTHPLLAGSPAIDTGNPATPGGGLNGACEPLDQRGVSRTAGSGVRCDVGAFEVTSSCVTGGRDLCLNDGRFRVNVAWNVPGGQFGPGQAVQLTDDTGYFWFFERTNVELTVKALDACAPPFNRYWVFLSGLTNVEVTITVTDTVSGQVKTYVNPYGRRFRPVQDTDAFNTCG